MLERFRGLSHTVLGPIARLLVKLGVSPDVVTIIGTLGVVLGALICFPQGWLWQGVVVVIIFVISDMIACLVPLLKTRGFSSLPVHFLGKAATFSLLYAFPLVLLGSGEQGWLQLAWVLGWAFAIWGTALYWYAGGLYVAQTVNLLRTVPPLDRRQHRGVAG